MSQGIDLRTEPAIVVQNERPTALDSVKDIVFGSVGFIQSSFRSRAKTGFRLLE